MPESLTADAQVPGLADVRFRIGVDNEAFGAGLLNGWSAAGDRPTFKLVTGVSTGALIAPFAFLGPKYDASLKEFYTNVSAEDILQHRSLIAAVTDDALADDGPLWGHCNCFGPLWSPPPPSPGLSLLR